MNYTKTVSKVEIDRFMGKWYVMAGRFTFLESEVHNGVEIYTWNEKEKRIDISFTFNKGSLTGKEKSIPQKGWIENNQTNAHWKVSPFWPLKFDYLVLDLADDYSWTAIGVPNGKYLWIMSRQKMMPEKQLNDIITRLKESGYPVHDIVLVPHAL
jgi:apolipoprotein D and lipocalin family protein